MSRIGKEQELKRTNTKPGVGREHSCQKNKQKPEGFLCIGLALQPPVSSNKHNIIKGSDPKIL